MTKEELEKEATEFEENYTVYEVAKREDGSDYAKKVCKVTVKEAYLAGAEPREKQIEILSKHILELQADKGRLIDELAKAKEIIKTYYEDNFDEAEFYFLRKKAEQFLSEVEK